MIDNLPELSETVVFDIVDELTDEPGFETWWRSLSETKRTILCKAMEEHVTSNIERQAAVDLKKAGVVCQKS